MIKLKNILTEESAMKAIINAKKGAKASGGGYSSWTKIGNNSWKNKKTGRLSHNAGLYDKIGEFSDFVIEGKLTEAKPKPLVSKKDIKDIEKSGNIDIAYKKAMALLKSLSEGNVNEYGGAEFSKITALQNFLTIDLDKFEKGLKDSKHKAIYKKARKQFMGTVSAVAFEHSKLHEGKLTEDAVASFTKELNGERIKAKVYTATGDGKTIEAQFTNKKWEDGVPVTKNLTRGGYKSLKTPRGKFKVIETDKFFYYEINNGWAAVSRKRYTTPPFEY